MKYPAHIWSNIFKFFSLEELLTLRNQLIGFEFYINIIRDCYINNLKKKTNKAVIHLVALDNDGEDIKSSQLKKNYPGIFQMMKRGDIIEDINESGYRSQGIWFFDGEGIIYQYYELDDYGTPPIEFELITEFPPGYWDQEEEENNLAKVNQWYVTGESQFYWHQGSCVLSPLGQNLNPMILEKINHHLQNITIKDANFNYIIFEHLGTLYLLHICGDVNYNQLNTKEIFVKKLEYYLDQPELIDFLSKNNIKIQNVLTDEW